MLSKFLNPLGSRDLKYSASEKFQISLILAIVLNFKRSHILKTVRDSAICRKLWHPWILETLGMRSLQKFQFLNFGRYLEFWRKSKYCLC